MRAVLIFDAEARRRGAQAERDAIGFSAFPPRLRVSASNWRPR
jgi:hypothetical protein